MKLRTRVRALFIIIILICSYWLYPDNYFTLILGGALILIGQTIHFISAGYLVKQTQLITAGPYSYVRNPFYVASFFMDVGLCIAFQNIYIAIVYLPIFYLWIIRRRTRKEEKFLQEQFGEKYTQYCAAVPRFFPRLRRAQLTEKNGAFDWQLILKYREQWRFIRILGLIIFCYLRKDIGHVTEFSDITDALAEPINMALTVILIFILFAPPIYEFVLKKLWKPKKSSC